MNIGLFGFEPVDFTSGELKKIAKTCRADLKNLKKQIAYFDTFKHMISFLAERKCETDCYTVFNIQKKKENGSIVFDVQKECYNNKPELHTQTGEVLYGDILSFSKVRIETLSDLVY